MSTFQIVTFSLGKEFYGVNIGQVQEIIRLSPITMIPQTPQYVVGLLNLRGNVIPVIDLRIRLGFKMPETTSENRIIVVGVADSVVGFIVDSVSEVMTVNDSMLQESPDMVASVDTEYIHKVIQDQERLVVLLDTSKLIQS